MREKLIEFGNYSGNEAAIASWIKGGGGLKIASVNSLDVQNAVVVLEKYYGSRQGTLFDMG